MHLTASVVYFSFFTARRTMRFPIGVEHSWSTTSSSITVKGLLPKDFLFDLNRGGDVSSARPTTCSSMPTCFSFPDLDLAATSSTFMASFLWSPSVSYDKKQIELKEAKRKTWDSVKTISYNNLCNIGHLPPRKEQLRHPTGAITYKSKLKH